MSQSSFETVPSEKIAMIRLSKEKESKRKRRVDSQARGYFSEDNELHCCEAPDDVFHESTMHLQTSTTCTSDEIRSMSKPVVDDESMEFKQPKVTIKQVDETANDDWLYKLFQRKEEEMKKEMMMKQQTNSDPLPDILPNTEKEYTSVFKTFIADGVSVKNEISSKLQCSLDWVVSVSLGFSMEQNGYWPVIKVSPNKTTCDKIRNKEEFKTFLKKEAAESLQQALKELYSKSWTQEELESTIEITEHYPLKSYGLCTAGGKITTKWTSKVSAGQEPDAGHYDAKYIMEGKATCNIRVQLTVGEEVHPSHYTITTLHTLAPYEDYFFRSGLPPLPKSGEQENDVYEHLDKIPPELTLINCPSNSHYIDDSSNPLNPRQIDDLLAQKRHAVQTLLRISLFSDRAAKVFELMKASSSFSISLTTTTDETADLLVAQIGLFKKMKQENPASYQQVLVNDPELSENDQIVKHPCNIDIAILKCENDAVYEECSIEESLQQLNGEEGIDLPQQITWLEPPSDDIEEWKGNVVYIKEGVVYKLSDRVSHLTSTSFDKYPNCSWEENPYCERVQQGDSGSPVFLLNDNSLRLVGSLMTKQNASLIGFSLEVIKSELLMYHTQQVIEQMGEEYQYTTKNQADLKQCLENYRKYLEIKKKEHSLSPIPKLNFSELKSPIKQNVEQEDDRSITNKIEVCILKHTNSIDESSSVQLL